MPLAVSCKEAATQRPPLSSHSQMGLVAQDSGPEFEESETDRETRPKVVLLEHSQILKWPTFTVAHLNAGVIQVVTV